MELRGLVVVDKPGNVGIERVHEVLLHLEDEALAVIGPVFYVDVCLPRGDPLGDVFPPGKRVVLSLA